MKKFYSLLIMLALLLPAVAAPKADIKKRHRVKTEKLNIAEVMKSNQKKVETQRTQKSKVVTFNTPKIASRASQGEGVTNSWNDSIFMYSADGYIIEKEYYLYDNDGNIICEEFHEWSDTLQALIPESKYKYEYADGNIVLETDYEWKNNAWAQIEQIEYKRGENDVTKYHSIWKNNRWIRDNEYFSFFDQQNRDTLNINFIYDDNYVLLDGYKTQQAYDALGNIIFQANYLWKNNDWKKHDMYIFGYDKSGNYILEEQYYSDSLNQWKGSYKQEREYLYDQYVSKELYYHWENGTWLCIQKTERDFDASANITSEINYSYDWELGQLVKYNHINYTNTYDDGLIKMAIGQYLAGDGSWINQNKTEFTYDGNQNNTSKTEYLYTSYIDSTGVHEYWQSSAQYLMEYDSDKNVTRYEYKTYSFIPDSSGNDIYRWVTQLLEIKKYDSNKNVIFLEAYIGDYEGRSLIGAQKFNAAFKNADELYPTLYEYYSWDYDNNQWIESSKYVNDYNDNGDYTLEEYYSWNKNAGNWEGNYKDVTLYTDEGYAYIAKYYNWHSSEWVLNEYEVYYPFFLNSSNNKVEAEETTPVGDDNKGKFELALTIPSDATITGSFIVEFPQGLTLDKDATKLNDEFADNFYLTYTPQDGNKWLIEIKKNEIRSSSSLIVYKKIIDVAYTVQQAQSNKQQIIMNNINFDLSDGSNISQDEVIVNIEIRNATGIDADNTVSGVNVYANNSVLYVNSDDAELVNVYAIDGKLLYNIAINAGQNEIQGLTTGTLVIVKGQSGWVKKVIIQ
ncbi:hypothetical protein D0T53_02010 [Dysgonomonas sp. 216]|uniref:hypothetical protein n=1 Tax=Dysgonomonas sp. 216 TaxID=2302934 RepID=UPI0013D23CB5|nr:hypothetical protein [Dysgonomonas sp. 216]NDW17689.1 hypothetical protein [Dysgonomonas sp. 216]